MLDATFAYTMFYACHVITREQGRASAGSPHSTVTGTTAHSPGHTRCIQLISPHSPCKYPHSVAGRVPGPCRILCAHLFAVYIRIRVYLCICVFSCAACVLVNVGWALGPFTRNTRRRKKKRERSKVGNGIRVSIRATHFASPSRVLFNSYI